MSEEMNYWQRMMRKRLSRRDILRSGALSGIGLAAGSAILGCGNQAKPSTTSTVGGKAQEEPVSGGVLNHFIQADPPNFELISSTTDASAKPLAPIYNQVVQTDPLKPGTIIPDLAEKWDVSQEGKVYDFHLKKGVKFHDGKPFTAADVKATFDYVINPSKGIVSSRKALFSMVDHIETPDDYTARFVLKWPSASLLDVLAFGFSVVYPKHILDEKGNMQKDAIGTGPFKLKEYVRGNFIELVKNPDYHVKGRPYVDGMKYFIMPDQGTINANFRTGQLDFGRFFATVDVEDFLKDAGEANFTVVRGVKSISTNLRQLSFGAKNKPWDDVRVREAVSYAIDRNEGVKIILQGDGAVSGIMPPGTIWAYPSAELEKIPGYGKDTAANVAAGKKLLAEAGYPSGLNATLLTRQGDFYEPLSVFLKDQLAKIGINAKLDIKETTAFYDGADKRNFDLLAFNLTAALPEPDAIFGEYDVCGATRNYSEICGKEVPDLFDKQRRTVNVDERLKLVSQMEKSALLSYSRIIVCYSTGGRVAVYAKRLRNYVLGHASYANLRFEHVWLTKQ